MMNASMEITALVLTYNEEENILRTLRSIAWVDQILVVDSGSSDQTLDIVAGFSNARVVQNPFISFADQCNFGLRQIETEWVLSIDADYCFPATAEAEIRTAIETPIAGFAAQFEYAIEGKVVRGSILPARTVLYRRQKACYQNDGHGHRVGIDGHVEDLQLKITHDDRKPLARWLASQNSYAAIEAEKISTSSFSQLSPQDRVRKCILFAPMMVFVLTYVIRGGFMSGWHGFFYASQRFCAELLLSLCLIDRMLEPKSTR